MKQITYIILAAMLLLCGGFGYERLMADRDTDMNRKGELSDIAESVTAIPLKPINGKSLTDAHDTKRRERSVSDLSRYFVSFQSTRRIGLSDNPTRRNQGGRLFGLFSKKAIDRIR